MKWPAHGGNPVEILKLQGVKPNKKPIDFSANLNPLGAPEQPSLDRFSVGVYPDPEYTDSTKAVAAHHGLSMEYIRLTNGGAEAIFLIAHLFTGKRAMIVDPTFSEYERACQAHKLSVTRVQMDANFTFPYKKVMANLREVDLVFLCRPNNPTGTLIPYETIIQIVHKAALHHTTVIIDEAFVHFLPEEEKGLSDLLNTYQNLILLRSLTKIYAIPGLRVGYVMAHPRLIAAIRHLQVPWSVNSVAAGIVPDVISNNKYLTESRRYVQEQLMKMKGELHKLNFFITDSVVNFYLLRDPLTDETDALFNFLLENGIIPRHTHTFLGLEGSYLRFAIRSQEENERLLDALQLWRKLTC